jgi:hypothetical protein
MRSRDEAKLIRLLDSRKRHEVAQVSYARRVRGLSRFANHSASGDTSADWWNCAAVSVRPRGIGSMRSIGVDGVDMIFSGQLGAVGADQRDQFAGGDLEPVITLDADLALVGLN